MLEKVQVGLEGRGYSIWIGDNIMSQLPTALEKAAFPKRVAVVTNPTVGELYLSPLQDLLVGAGYDPVPVTIPDGEEYKTLETLESIYDALIAHHFDRSCGLLALGGGVVGDITGFAAATFMRGIPYVQVPTTLLAQVDSSVGGKTAVNHPLGKNLIGAFYQPCHVHIDVRTLNTLNDREFAAGMAEVVKYGIIADGEFFNWLLQQQQSLGKRDASSLIRAVKSSCQIKANIVEEDERESSLRAILNYGHTFGHAVETLTRYQSYRHGEAVAIGMVVAARIARDLGMCSQDEVAAIEGLLKDLRLPVVPPSFPLSDYLEAMGRDKKVREGRLRLILNRGIGACEIREVPAPEEVFAPVLESFPKEQGEP